MQQSETMDETQSSGAGSLVNPVDFENMQCTMENMMNVMKKIIEDQQQEVHLRNNNGDRSTNGSTHGVTHIHCRRMHLVRQC